jgi:plastocyanin
MRRRFSTFWFALALALLLSSARAAETVVFIYDYYFAPTNVTIAPGDTVTWINKGFQPHDTTSSQGFWASPLLYNDEEFFSHTFTQGGQYPYVCLSHVGDYPYQTGLVVVASANVPPSVRITSPANGASFTAPASFTITAEGSDSDGTVAGIQLLMNGTPVGGSPGSTFTTNVSSLGAGNYSFSAVATDDQGATATSGPVNIVVGTAVKYPLTISVVPSNGGIVTASPPQPLDGHDAGTIVTLTASAGPGFAFSGWSGAATGAQNPLMITMDSPKSITANFISNTVPTHTLTLSVNPPNSGTIQVAPAPNGPDGTYLEGTAVTLTATPALNFAFTNWTGDVNSTSNSVALTIDADKTVTANFFESITPTFVLTVLTNPPGAGSIQVSPPPNGTNGTYIQGTVVTLTATAIGANAFTNWTGAVSSTSNRITVVMDADKSVTANFIPVIPPSFTLTVTASPAGAGLVIGSPPPGSNGTFSAGTVVALLARPNAGFRFIRWTGADTSTNNPIPLVMNGNKSLTAIFEAIPPLDFGELAGVFNGLLFDERETNYTTSGFISLRVSRTGAYRGTATIGGIRELVAGQFDRFGYAPLVVRRATLSGSLQIDSTGEQMTGLITDGRKSPALLLYRTGPSTNLQSLVGAYSLTIGAVTPIETEGAAEIRILDNGSVRVHGVLGDRTVFHQRTFISVDARVPVFVRLYGGRGAILGWIDVAPNGAAQGSLRWFRPGNSRDLNYPEGFALKVPVRATLEGIAQFRRAKAGLLPSDPLCSPRPGTVRF